MRILNVRWKAGKVYIIAAALILVSWLGNIAYYYDSKLPQAGFLRHYIETTDEGGASFMLLYAANRQDKRQIRNVEIDGWPHLRFYPPMIHAQLQHQTIYRIIGRFVPLENPTQKQTEPVIISEIGVHYNDGTYVQEKIGEIRVYPQAAHVDEMARPVTFTSTSGSSDGSGRTTMNVTRPVSLTHITSALLPVLGNSFEWQVTSSGRAITPPAQLEQQLLSVAYKYRFAKSNPMGMDVFQVLIQLNLRDKSGQEWTNHIVAAHTPYPTESEMRSYVRRQKEART